MTFPAQAMAPETSKITSILSAMSRHWIRVGYVHRAIENCKGTERQCKKFLYVIKILNLRVKSLI
jgi:hypothetical protein